MVTLRREPAFTTAAPATGTVRHAAQPERPPVQARPPRRPIAALHPVPESATTITIELHMVPAALANATAGISLSDAETGADLGWLPLQPQPGTQRLEISVAAAGPLTLTVARAREFSRHGYLLRASHRFARLPSPHELLVLDAQAHQVRFEVGADRSAGPLRLVRVGDLTWRPIDAFPAGFSLRPGQVVETMLGSGDYELSDPLDPARMQRFTVPAPQAVRISESLSRPAAGRP